MKRQMHFGWILLLLLSIASCSKDEDMSGENGNEEKDKAEMVQSQIQAKDYEKWYYYSLKENRLIGEGSANPKDEELDSWNDRKDWDIAFHRANFRINGAIEGSNVGVVAIDSGVLDEITKAPENGYLANEIHSILISAQHGTPGSTADTEISPIAGEDWSWGWASYAHDEGTWTLFDSVFLLHTIDNRYVKIKFKNFLNAEDESGWITLDYAYQKEESMNF